MAVMRRCCALMVLLHLVIFVAAENNSYKHDDITLEWDPAACKDCEAVQDKDDKIYYLVAQISMKKYQEDQGFGQYQLVEEVTGVYKQNLTGRLFRINFNTAPTNCTVGSNEILSGSACKLLDTSHYLSCILIIGENSRLGKKPEISCKNESRSRNILGGQSEQNPSSAKYRDLAEESFMKYMEDNGLTQHHEIIQLKKVTTQVVAGIITRIDFNAKLDFSKVISCHAEIWDRPWLNLKEINVTCIEQNNKQKREIPGGLAEQNIDDPVYRDMAEDSLLKYMRDNGLNQQHEILQVRKVTTQVVAGIITRIDFNAKLDSSNVISCHTEIWDRPWLNKKEINITCVEQNNKQKRQIPGGLAEQNVDDSVYRDMAEKSLMKYMRNNGLNQQHEILQVKKVTTQVVAGIITRIDFDAKLDSSNVISCHSEIWDRPWLNLKEIDVTCVEQNNKKKRQIPGGLREENVNDAFYRDMAEEP